MGSHISKLEIGVIPHNWVKNMNQGKTIVEKIIEYRDTQNSAVLGDVSNADNEELNVIAIEILSWLKLQRKRELWLEQGRKISLKPMELNMSFPWCKTLVGLLQKNNVFSETFCVDGNSLNIREDVSEEIAHEMRIYADEKYNPQMIIG